MNKNIRWKQRFQNFQKVYKQLDAAVFKEELSTLERTGLIKIFECSFELAWKTLKDFLESEGITATTPRQVIQEAFKSQFIKDGHAWIDVLEKRNLLAQCYREELSVKAISLIKRSYFPFLLEFKDSFKSKV